MPTNPIDVKKQPLAEILRKDRQSLSEWEKILLGKVNFESSPYILPRATRSFTFNPPSWWTELMGTIKQLPFKTLRDIIFGDFIRTQAPLNRPRSSLAAFTINQKIWVVGGVYEDGTIADIEVYDPVTNVWSVIPNPTNFSGEAFVVVGNDLIYAVGMILGGNYVYAVFEYNTQTNALTQKADLPIPCSSPGLAAGPDGKI